jgi:hypothetical protein
MRNWERILLVYLCGAVIISLSLVFLEGEGFIAPHTMLIGDVVLLIIAVFIQREYTLYRGNRYKQGHS